MGLQDPQMRRGKETAYIVGFLIKKRRLHFHLYYYQFRPQMDSSSKFQVYFIDFFWLLKLNVSFCLPCLPFVFIFIYFVIRVLYRWTLLLAAEVVC